MLKLIQVTFKIIGYLLEYLWHIGGKLCHVRIIMTRPAMIVTHMRKYILLLRLHQLIKWVLGKVIVKIREMDESTPELIDGLRPSL